MGLGDRVHAGELKKRPPGHRSRRASPESGKRRSRPLGLTGSLPRPVSRGAIRRSKNRRKTQQQPTALMYDSIRRRQMDSVKGDRQRFRRLEESVAEQACLAPILETCGILVDFSLFASGLRAIAFQTEPQLVGSYVFSRSSRYTDRMPKMKIGVNAISPGQRAARFGSDGG